MEFFLFKSGTWVKIITVLGSLGIRWLYSYLYFSVSDGSISNEDEVEGKDTPPITSLPIMSKVVRKAPQAASLPQIAAAKPIQPTSHAIEARKSSFNRKRKLFRNALLMDTLMHRKDYIT